MFSNVGMLLVSCNTCCSMPLPWEVMADFYKTVINAIHIGNSLPACVEFPGRGGQGD